MMMIWLVSSLFSVQVGAGPVDLPQPQELIEGREVRAMCAGESREAAEFRTEAALALHAEIQRQKCRIYLLGIAEGIEAAAAARGEPRCVPYAADREALAEVLGDAVAARAGDPSARIGPIVRTAVRAQFACGG